MHGVSTHPELRTIGRRRFLHLSSASLAIGTLTACQRLPIPGAAEQHPAPKVDRGPDEVIFAPPPTLDITDGMKEAEPLVKALGETSGLNVKVLIPSDASMAMLWLREGKVDVAWLWPLFYVKSRENFGADLLLRTLEAGKVSRSSLVVARKSADVAALAQLKGRRIAATDPGDAMGWIYPAAELKKAGVDPMQDAEVEFREDAEDTVINLLTKDDQGEYEFDAAFTVEDALGSKKVADKLKVAPEQVQQDTVVLQKVEGVPTAVLAARPGLDKQTADALRQALLGLKGGSDALKPYGVDGFAEGKDADFNDLRERAKAIGIPLKDT